MDANKKDGTVPLINNLKIIKVFKYEDKEERAGITDLIN